jgi:kynureninase
MRVIPDFRAPDNIRLGLAPLYNTFEEVYSAMVRLREIVEEKVYRQFGDERQEVT